MQALCRSTSRQPALRPAAASPAAAAAAARRPCLPAAQQPRRQPVACRAASTTAPLPTEAEAVAAFKAAKGGGALEPCLALLRQAAADKSVAPQLVEGALAWLEQNHSAPSENIEGVWRLVFSTATSNRFFQYIPVVEDFVIRLAEKQCALESVVGPFPVKIRGEITSWDGSTGEMAFQFNTVDILLLGKQMWQLKPKTKPKTYTFFYEAGNIAAVRSSAGGLTLLRK